MLQHESQELPTTTPAAQIRVTSEELTEAINALQASKDEAARRLAGTVPIGEVVKELNLEATPEEVWAQVQKQRAQAAQGEAAAQAAAEKAVTEKAAADAPHEAFHRAAREVGHAAVQAVAAAQAAAQAASAQASAAQAGAQVYSRPRRRRWPWWSVLGIGFAIYGIAHGNLVHVQTSGVTSSQNIVVNDDNQIQMYNVEGREVVINGDNCTVTLSGRASSVVVNGDNDVVIGDTANSLVTNGDNDTVKWGGAPVGSVIDKGHNSHITVPSP